MTAKKDALPAKLSRDQRWVLENLLRYVEAARRSGHGLRRFTAETLGVPLRWLRPRSREGTRTGSDRAAFSRTLARLEARGLVVRGNTSTGMTNLPAGHAERGKCRTRLDQPPPRRANSVILTATGEAVAKRLTFTPGPNVNRFLGPP